MSNRFSNPFPRFFSDNGTLLSGGRLYFYEAGSTTTPKDTYSDTELTIANSNPVVLTDSGVIPDIYLNGNYKVVLTNSSGVQVDEADDIGTATEGIFDDWVSTTTYGSGGNNIVTGSDGNYYVSIQASNTGQNPISSPAYWTQITFTRVYNTNETYSDGDIVKNSDGLLFRSIADSNTGQSLTDVDYFLPISPYQGTFTPVLELGGGTTGITYSTQQGIYVVNGPMCTVFVTLVLTSKGSDTGAATISGIPYPADTVGSQAIGNAVGQCSALAGASYGVFCNIGGAAGTEIALFNDATTTSASAALLNSDLTNNSIIRLTFSYMISTS